MVKFIIHGAGGVLDCSGGGGAPDYLLAERIAIVH